MPKSPYDLPPMSALVAFEAAARHVSFVRAAQELNVTPAAVSHQIKALERALNCSLFERHHRGVALTETGAYLLVALQRGFEGIGEAVDQLRRRAMQASVTISVTTAVSSLWLTPKLAQFWKTHGDVSVAQMVSDTDTPPAQCDLSIRYSILPRDRTGCTVLFRDRLMAIASPGFAAAHPVTSLADLAALPLIHFETRIAGWTDWQGWFQALGHTGPLRNSHRVNNYLIALQAARDDMGAVLGWVGLARTYLHSGQLVPLLPDQVTPREDFHVTLHAPHSRRARLVYDWLVDSAGAEHPAWHASGPRL
ncbi:MAG: LysR family transcriptional regulator [Rhodobacteraceae bacterium]|nr:MAG: LysR family transcriptional regulator [Paracoccaceae bacterium]